MKLLNLLKNIDSRFNTVERQLKLLNADIDAFEQQLSRITAAEQLQYAELARSVHNRLEGVRSELLK